MKLKNKKTGAIYSIGDIELGNNEDGIWLGMTRYESLADFNDEWEDYEEPERKHWYMTSWGEVWQYGDDPLHEEWRIILGNDFETKEEAEKAVEKLRAWKRLKDKNFHFLKYSALGCGEIEFSLDFEDIDDEGEIGELQKDLDLLFGGEE